MHSCRGLRIILGKETALPLMIYALYLFINTSKFQLYRYTCLFGFLRCTTTNAVDCKPIDARNWTDPVIFSYLLDQLNWIYFLVDQWKLFLSCSRPHGCSERPCKSFIFFLHRRHYHVLIQGNN